MQLLASGQESRLSHLLLEVNEATQATQYGQQTYEWARMPEKMLAALHSGLLRPSPSQCMPGEVFQFPRPLKLLRLRSAQDTNILAALPHLPSAFVLRQDYLQGRLEEQRVWASLVEADPLLRLELFVLPPDLPRPVALPHLAKYYSANMNIFEIVCHQRLTVPEQVIVLVLQLSDIAFGWQLLELYALS